MYIQELKIDNLWKHLFDMVHQSNTLRSSLQASLCFPQNNASFSMLPKFILEEKAYANIF